MISAVLPTLSGGIAPSILAGIEEVCAAEGVFVEVANARMDGLRQRAHLERLTDSPTDGAIVLPCAYPADSSALTAVRSIGLPLVVVDHEVAGIACDEVFVDNAQGGRLAGQCLLATNADRYICFYNAETQLSTCMARLSGFRDALAAGGITPLDEVGYHTGGVRPKWTPIVDQVASRLADGGRVGVFCDSDEAAVAVYHAASQTGRRIGDDVFVVGFDDSVYCTALQPPLTSVRQPTEAIGVEAATLLIDRLKGRTAGADFTRRVLTVELVERASSRPRSE